MKKALFIILLLIAAGVVIYVTFIIAIIKISIGAVFLGILAIALLALWIMWKKETDD